MELDDNHSAIGIAYLSESQRLQDITVYTSPALNGTAYVSFNDDCIVTLLIGNCSVGYCRH
jgi:hypothetical protein